MIFCLFVCVEALTSQSTIFQLCLDGATASWALPVLSWLKDTTQRRWVSNPRPLASESDALPLSHRTPPVSYEFNHYDYHKISKVYFELNTRAIGWSAKECASIALCEQGYTENRPAGCLQSVLQITPIPIAWDWLTVRPTDRLTDRPTE